jgi:peptidoglycan/xylan/chitin deacetylase (PgdA/CDA1 family)
MGQTEFNRKKKGRKKRLLADIGARIAKSLCFLGMAAVLASSAYTDIKKLSQPAGDTVSVQPETGTGKAEPEEMSEPMSVSGQSEVNTGKKESAEMSEPADTSGQNAGKAESAEMSEPADTSGQLEADAGTLDAAEMTEGNIEEKRVALTFDDGPHRIYTAKLLDGLLERSVKATFFVIGENIPGNEELIARMYQEGHLIGNHTYDHVKISDMSAEDACEQVQKTSDLIRAITGEDTEFVRPPFGAWNKELEAPFTMIPVLWDVDPLDWTTKNTALVEERILSEVEDGDIILLHDCYESSVDAALAVVDELQAQGYEFVRVDRLILE